VTLTLTIDRVEVTLVRICGRGLPTHQIRWKSEKLFVDVRSSNLLGHRGGDDLKMHDVLPGLHTAAGRVFAADRTTEHIASVAARVAEEGCEAALRPVAVSTHDASCRPGSVERNRSSSSRAGWCRRDIRE